MKPGESIRFPSLTARFPPAFRGGLIEAAKASEAAAALGIDSPPLFAGASLKPLHHRAAKVDGKIPPRFSRGPH